MNKLITELRSKRVTMVSVDRLEHLVEACNTVNDNSIEGVFVECGVWMGGASIIAGKILKDKELWMYDTFDGLTEPCEFDFTTKKSADTIHDMWTKDKLCFASMDSVKKNLDNYGVEARLIPGDACETTKNIKPESISILRLDMDLYEPTKIALEELYPLLSKGGYLLIDDYYTWDGARKAVDEYFGESNIGNVKVK